LLGYWVLLMFIPVPGYGAGVLTHAGTWNAWFDQRFLPGHFYRNRPYDPEGLLSHLPAMVNALLGSFAGRWLADPVRCPKRKAAYLATAGLVCLVLGWLWHPLFPVNKELWTSSFVLVTCGWGAVLLAVFYAVIDVAGFRWLGWPLAVIGANAILIYLSTSFVKWSYTADGLFGGFVRMAPQDSQALLRVISILLVQWGVLAWMYRKRLFVRV
jgi:predicted acyltransferase